MTTKAKLVKRTLEQTRKDIPAVDKVAQRVKRLWDEDINSVFQKLLNSKFNKENIDNALAQKWTKTFSKFYKLPINSPVVNNIGKLWVKMAPEYYNNIRILPNRSKNPYIDILSKDIQTNKNVIKNYLQSKQYREKLRKAGISEKEYINTAQDVLDINISHLGYSHDPYINGASTYGGIILSQNNADSYTILHELTHMSQQCGSPKMHFSNNNMEPQFVQGKVHNYNQKIINNMPEKVINLDTKYFGTPQEIQANIQPLQIMMQQNGWQPKQMNIEFMSKRGLLDNSDVRQLYDTFGEKNMKYLLANILKKGGKL